MEKHNNKTPLRDLNAFEQKARLKDIVLQAYHRRSRNLPANLDEIVETLKGDLLKSYPDCPIETIDDAIVTETLHDPDAALSVTFFFNAVKKAWFTPRVNAHTWESKTDDDLAYWSQRRKELEDKGLQGTDKYAEACEMIRHYEQGDTEQDTISLLDTCASKLKAMDAYEKKGYRVAKVAVQGDIRIPLPAFNARREFAYLAMRRQIAFDADLAHLDQAIEEVNQERLREHHNRVDRSHAKEDPDVMAMAKRLAVLRWLRACTIRNTTPSAILTPLAEETSYQNLRRTI